MLQCCRRYNHSEEVKLPDYVANRTVFVEVAQYSDGDAYDRTGSIFLIPTDKKQSFLDALRDLNSVPAFRSGETDYHGLVSTDNYNVPMELMRFSPVSVSEALTTTKYRDRTGLILLSTKVKSLL